MTMIRDGDWVLVSHDPATGRSTWRLDLDGKTIIRHDFPVDPLLRTNEFLRNHVDQKGEWRLAAKIPMNMLHDTDLGRAHSEGDDKYVSRFLNDSDNRAWRTSGSKL